MPPKSEPLRLRQWKPVSLPEGVLMALTHCLEQQNIKKMADKRHTGRCSGGGREDRSPTLRAHSVAGPVPSMLHAGLRWYVPTSWGRAVVFANEATEAQREENSLQVHNWEARAQVGWYHCCASVAAEFLETGCPCPPGIRSSRLHGFLIPWGFRKWPEKITSHGRWEVGTGPLGVHFWTESLQGGGNERLWQPGHGLGGEMGSAPSLVLQPPPPGAKATDLALGARQCWKKAFSSSELLCCFWILHHFWALWPYCEVPLQ